MSIKRGEIYWVGLDPVKGSEQSGRRPALILQNNVGNEFSPTTLVAPLTTKSYFESYPVNVNVPKGIAGLKSDSTVLLSQIRAIDKNRLENKVGRLPESFLQKVDLAAKVSLGLE